MKFPRQEYLNGLPCSPPGDLSNRGIQPTSLAFPTLQVDSLPLNYQRNPLRARKKGTPLSGVLSKVPFASQLLLYLDSQQ